MFFLRNGFGQELHSLRNLDDTLLALALFPARGRDSHAHRFSVIKQRAAGGYVAALAVQMQFYTQAES